MLHKEEIRGRITEPERENQAVKKSERIREKRGTRNDSTLLSGDTKNLSRGRRM